MSSTDVFSPEKRSAVMARVKGRDTGPERLVRRLLHGAGYRFRLQGTGLPGRPDLVFTRRRTVVFVHGCFWHGHDCARGARQPKANAAYWLGKIDRNRVRDAAVGAELAARGWTALTVWECELKQPDAVLGRLREALGPARQATSAAASGSTSGDGPSATASSSAA